MKPLKVTHYHRAFFWTVLLIVVIWTRLYRLDLKPLHFDEAINGWFTMQMQETGYYKYDPNNYHGPLYFQLLYWFESLWGRSVETLRSLPAVFSVLAVMIFTLRPLDNKKVQNCIAVFLLLSPAFLFFGRSGIHEMPFAFFQILLALGILRWFESKDGKSLALVLIGLWGMFLLKETAAITVLCFGVALMSLGFKAVASWATEIKVVWSRKLSLLSFLLLITFIQLYSGFFKYPQGLVDFINAFLPWAKTGVHGNGHEKEFWYWIKVLWQAEPLVLGGVGFAIWGVFAKSPALRVMSVFSLMQLFVYSLIPYKTVWCILTLIWGFYFVLAFTLTEMNWSRRAKAFLVSALVLGAGLNLQSAYDAVYKEPLDFNHSYFYVNSTLSLQGLQQTILAEVKNNKDLLNAPVQLGMKEYWPWPWLLRSFSQLRYESCGREIVQDAAIYFCDLDDADFVESQLQEIQDSYWKLTIPMRQEKEVSVVYLKKSFFDETKVKAVSDE